jgi:hypothetical protein
VLPRCCAWPRRPRRAHPVRAHTPRRGSRTLAAIRASIAAIRARVDGGHTHTRSRTLAAIRASIAAIRASIEQLQYVRLLLLASTCDACTCTAECCTCPASTAGWHMRTLPPLLPAGTCHCVQVLGPGRARTHARACWGRGAHDAEAPEVALAAVALRRTRRHCDNTHCKNAYTAIEHSERTHTARTHCNNTLQ